MSECVLTSKYFEEFKEFFLEKINKIENSYKINVKLEDEYKFEINNLSEKIKEYKIKEKNLKKEIENKNKIIEDLTTKQKVLLNQKKIYEIELKQRYKEMEEEIKSIKNNESIYKENDFNIKKEINYNEYGTLYCAFSKKDNIDVCLKKINIQNMEQYYKNLGYKEINYLEHLNNENELRKLLSINENCVKFYGEFQKIKEKFIVFEKCDGDLENLLKKRKKSIDEEEIKKIFVKINKILEVMNNKNIIHRDLKLKNFLIKYTNKEKTEYKVKLSDFGIGQFLNNNNYKFNWNKQFETIAPEIFLSKIEKYEKSVDIFSLGIIFYQLSHNLKHPYKLNENGNLIFIYEKFYDKDDFNIIFDPSIKNKQFKNLVENMIKINPKNRIKWEDYLKHDFFKDNRNNDDSDFDDYFDKISDNENDLEKFYDYNKNSRD